LEKPEQAIFLGGSTMVGQDYRESLLGGMGIMGFGFPER
jgi:hypothetical protein